MSQVLGSLLNKTGFPLPSMLDPVQRPGLVQPPARTTQQWVGRSVVSSSSEGSEDDNCGPVLSHYWVLTVYTPPTGLVVLNLLEEWGLF